ncbi:LysR family transcriptional regulator [Sphingomonas histidinilytica]|uniref:DNA-binding transcriptional regulator, LysR family n=1 Tax=Rhizorhabdus histidinilytica TaxID=439228 RepID=A0A1T4ZQ39_9SPHN|nr:LysR family transcriptional regulator [Rhizorhabdus histidinilytica]MBO9378268.1 LysR family transcriptional regulator [Rhizorhabdus histidinilytica]SKB24800.1 DNA-binding transcriptional regulator, LysR family [Rhizorhabdus histidinilytica]
MIDGEGLAAFIAVADLRSFSRAADRLGIAQSVVSKRLRRLEDQIGAQLIDRSVRTDIRLTRIGAAFLPEASEAFAKLTATERLGWNLGRGSSGPLQIGFVFSAAISGVLGRILSALRKELPDLRLVPRLMETPEQLAALDAGRLDIGLIRPRPSYPARCRALQAHCEDLVVCLSAEHPLSAQAALSPRQLADQRFIVPQFHEQVGLIDNIRRLAEAGGFDLQPVVRTDDFVTAACLAAAGEGVVLAPASLSRLQLDGLQYRALRDFDEQLRTMLVHHVEAPGEALRVILRTLEGTAPHP